MPRGDFFIPCCDRQEFVHAFAASHALPGAVVGGLQHRIVCRSSTGYACETQGQLSTAGLNGSKTASAHENASADPSQPTDNTYIPRPDAADSAQPAVNCGLKVLPKVEQDTQGASGPLKPESPEPSPAVQATLEIVQAPARAFLPIKNNRQALPPFVVQVGLSVQDVQKQRQWGCAEVRAYVLTEADFNIMLVQRHLPLWLQRRILGAGPAGSADAAMRALDANAEPYQHMAGCDRASVDVALAPPAAHQQDHGTSAQGVAQATFADVDRAGKVRNALKFKYPTKQNKVYIVFAAVIGPDRDILIALLSQPSLVISRGEQRVQATEKFSMSAAVARTLWQDINDSILKTGGALYQLIDRPAGRSSTSRAPRRRQAGGGGGGSSTTRRRAVKRRSASGESSSEHDDGAAAEASQDGAAVAMSDRSAKFSPTDIPHGHFYVPIDARMEAPRPPPSVPGAPAEHFATVPFVSTHHSTWWDASNMPVAQAGVHDGPPPKPWQPPATWHHGQWPRQLSMQSATAHSDSVRGGTGDPGSVPVPGSGSNGRVHTGSGPPMPVGSTAPLPQAHSTAAMQAGADGDLRVTRSLPVPSQHPSSGNGIDCDRFDSSEAYEGRQEYSLHSGAKEAVTAERVAQEGALTGSESQGMSDGAAGDGDDTRSRRRACRRESAGTTHAALDPTKQLVDPGSHRVFFFPEKPRARSPQLPSRQVAQGASELTQGASRASGGYPLDAPVSGSATSAPPDGTAGDGEPKRAQNLMDLVQVDGCLPVDAARAAAAGATAQQPVGARQALAEQRAANGGASVPRSMELHRVAATDAALRALPHEIPLQPSDGVPMDSAVYDEAAASVPRPGTLVDMWHRRIAQHSLPRRLGGSTVGGSTMDGSTVHTSSGGLLTEGSGETHLRRNGSSGTHTHTAAPEACRHDAVHAAQEQSQEHRSHAYPLMHDGSEEQTASRLALPFLAHDLRHPHEGQAAPGEELWRASGEVTGHLHHPQLAHQQQVFDHHGHRDAQHARRESWGADSRQQDASWHRVMADEDPRTLAASPHSWTSSMPMRKASPPHQVAALEATPGATPPYAARGVGRGDACETSGRSPMLARRMSMSPSSGMPATSGRSVGGSGEVQHSAPTASGEQMSRGAVPHLAHTASDTVMRWGPDGYSAEYRLIRVGSGAAMPPRKVARLPPPSFRQDERLHAADAVYHTHSQATMRRMAATMQSPFGDGSARGLRRAVTVSGSQGMGLAYASRGARAAELQRQRGIDPIWRMQTGEVSLAAPDDHCEPGAFQQCGSAPTGGMHGPRSLGFENLHLQLQEPGPVPHAHDSVTFQPHHSIPLMHGLHGGSAPRMADPCVHDSVQMSGSEPVGTTSALHMHVSEASSAGVSVRESVAMSMDKTSQAWRRPQHAGAPHAVHCAGGNGLAHSAPATPGGLLMQWEALLPPGESIADLETFMPADSLDWDSGY